MAIKFDVLNRYTGKVQFTAEIDCAENELPSIKLGLAVKWAVKNRARLDGASLDRARLDGASLDGARLDGARLDGARLDRASLDGASLVRASLDGASLDRASLVGARLDRASLVGASLDRARLDGASLVGARLDRASLDRARLVDGGQRSDGYRFVGWIKNGVLQIRAGCRDFSITDAREHWARTRGGTPLGDETMCILDHIEKVAAIRGLTTAIPADKAA